MTFAKATDASQKITVSGWGTETHSVVFAASSEEGKNMSIYYFCPNAGKKGFFDAWSPIWSPDVKVYF